MLQSDWLITSWRLPHPRLAQDEESENCSVIAWRGSSKWRPRACQHLLELADGPSAELAARPECPVAVGPSHGHGRQGLV